MSEILHEHCVACRPGESPINDSTGRELLLQIPDWAIVTVAGVSQLKRAYRFRDFSGALTFVNEVGAMAETEGHHPDIALGWGYVRINWYTHAIKGLHRNDFICAARCDRLFEQG